MKDESLNTILPESKGIIIKGEHIVPLPFPFGKLPQVARAVSNLMDFATTMPDNLMEALKDATTPAVEGEKAKSFDPNILTFFLGLMEASIEDVMALIGISVRKPDIWVAELDPSEGLELTIAVFTVNYDFFTQKFSPALSGLLNKMNKLSEAPVAEKELPKQ